MNADQARQLLSSVLHQVAPDADLDDVGPDETLQEALDLDSIDFLNLVVGLSESIGVDIPERDYPELSSVEGAIAYLSSRTGGG